MGGRKAHSSRRGGILSPRTPTASGMALQCSGWHCGGGDGRTGLMVMEETRLTSPTSRRCPGRAWNRRPSSFRGFRRPPSRVQRSVRTRVGSVVSRSRHRPYRTVPYSGGDGLTRRVGGTTPGYDSQACQRRDVDSSLTWGPACVRTLNPPSGEQVWGR
jgi:hypothetical protein